MQRYYGIDLLDLYRPSRELSLRKIGVFVDHLPPESATVTALRNSVTPEVAAMSGVGADPAAAQWSVAEMLQATMIDELRQFRHMYLQAHSDRPLGPPPEPLARPGVGGKKRSKLTLKQRAMLDPRIQLAPEDDDPNPPGAESPSRTEVF